MKKIEWLINVFYYSIYRLDYNLHLIFNKVDPTLLLLKTPYIKKQSKRQNIKDPVAHLNKIFENPVPTIPKIAIKPKEVCTFVS